MENTFFKGAAQAESGILLSAAEAEEYRNFKRQKYIAAVNENIRKGVIDLSACQNVNELSSLCATAKKYAVACVRITPDGLQSAKAALAESQTKIDVLIGGTGKTLSKVKAYEGKLCVRGGAGELSVVVNHLLISAERFTELKKELKKILKKARGVPVKLFLQEKTDLSKLFRLSRLLGEVGVGLSLPFFAGVERLKLEEKSLRALEVRGVDTAEDFKKIVGAGVERIQTSRLSEIYGEMLKEAENYSFSVPVITEKEKVEPPRDTQSEESSPSKEEKDEKVEKDTILPTEGRENERLTPLEKAEHYRALIEEYKQDGR